ncbi:MAG: hypothetical protein ACE5JM_17535 [Armatimonadota bacterium]
MTQPMAGDAVRLTGEFMPPLAKEGDIGIIGGVVGRPDPDFGITFHASAFRGKSSAYSQGPEFVSCSGGPGAIAVNASELTATGETMPVRFWRWRSLPQAGGGEPYTLEVPVWEWAGRPGS